MDAALILDIDSSRARTAATDLAKLGNAASKMAADWAKTDGALRKANGQFASSTDVVREYGAEVYGLASKYNPALKAVYDFQRAETELNRAVALGVLSKEQAALALVRVREQLAATATASATAAAGINRASTAVNAAGAASGRVVRANQAAGKSYNHLAGQVQNASFQVGDFFVQIASGQAATVALAQQLPQLLGSMGVFGALAGAAVAIGGALVPMLLKSADNADAFDDALGKLTDGIKRYRDNATMAQQGTLELANEFGIAAPRAREMYEALAAIERLRLGASIGEGLTVIQGQLAGVVTDLQQYRAQTDQIGRDNWALEIADKFGLTVQQADRLANAIDATKLARGPAQTAAATAKLTEELLAAQRAGAKLPPEFLTAAESAAKITIEADRLNATLGTSSQYIGTATGQTANWAGSMAGVLSYVNAVGAALAHISGGAINFAGQRAEIALLKQGKTLQEAAVGGARERARLESKEIVAGLGVQNALARKGLEFAVNASKQAQISQGEELAGLQEIARAREAAAAKAAAGGGGKGGGGGRGDAELNRAENQFQKLEILMEKNSVFQIEKYAKDQETLRVALEKRLITEQEYAKKLEELRIGTFGFDFEQQALQYQLDQEALQTALDQKLISYETFYARMREMQWQRLLNEDNQSLLAQDLSNTASYFGQLHSLSGSGYDGLLKIQKGFAAASALVSAWQGYAKALADGGMTPWERLAWAGKILSAGLGAVNAIKGAGSGGGSSGKKGGAAASASTAAQQEPTKNILVNITGDDLFAGMAENIMQQIYSQSKDGRVIIERWR